MARIGHTTALLLHEFVKENWDDFLLLADHHGVTEREAHDRTAELLEPDNDD